MRSLIANIHWKFLAVALAYIFWLAVLEEKQGLRQLEVPVRFDHLEPSLALIGERPSSVVVRVQAAEAVVKELQPPDVDVMIDLSGLGVGEHSLRLRPDSPAIVPRRVGVKAVEVFPSVLKIRIEPKVSADVAVKAVLSGTPAEGYEITEITLNPAHVRIEGPESAITAIAEAPTREIPVEGAREPFEVEVQVDVANPDVRFTEIPRTMVSIKVSEKTMTRVFDRIAVGPLQSDHETMVRPSRTTITVSGPELLLTRIAPEDIVAFVDVTGLEPQVEPYKLEVQVMFSREPLGNRLEVTEISNTLVSVRIYERKLATDTPAEVHGG